MAGTATQPGFKYVTLTNNYAANFTGKWINLADLGAHQISWIIYHTDCTGTYKVEVTNDPRVAIDGTLAVGIKDITAYIANASLWAHPAGATATDLIAICGVPCGWARLSYTHSSGASKTMYVTCALPTWG